MFLYYLVFKAFYLCKPSWVPFVWEKDMPVIISNKYEIEIPGPGSNWGGGMQGTVKPLR